MNEEAVGHAHQTPTDPGRPVEIPPDMVDIPPARFFVVYYGRKCDQAIEKLDIAIERRKNAFKNRDNAHKRADKAEEQLRKEEERQRQLVAGRRQQGHTDEEIAEGLGYTLEELPQRYPRPT